MEIKEIPGFGGNYGVTATGAVYRIKKYNNSKDTPLKASMVSGYPAVSLSHCGKVVQRHVHRLVALAFYGIPAGMVVNHINGVMTDCRLENLEVCTYAHNEWHKREVLGKRASALAKLNEDQVREIRLLRETGLSLSEIGAKFGLTKGNVSFIVNRRTWRHVV